MEAEIKHKRIWVITEEDGYGVTPTKPRYEGAYTEYVRADLQRSTPEPVGWVSKVSMGELADGKNDGRVDALIWKHKAWPHLVALYLTPQAPEPVGEEILTCMGCGLDFDSADEVQSIFHERSCEDFQEWYGQDIAQEIGRRLYRHPPTVGPQREPVAWTSQEELDDASEEHGLRMWPSKTDGQHDVPLYPSPQRESGEREALAGLFKMIKEQGKHADWVVPGDWACVECRPSSDVLEPGFQCAFHRAKAILATPTVEPTESQNEARADGSDAQGEERDLTEALTLLMEYRNLCDCSAVAGVDWWERGDRLLAKRGSLLADNGRKE